MSHHLNSSRLLNHWIPCVDELVSGGCQWQQIPDTRCDVVYNTWSYHLATKNGGTSWLPLSQFYSLLNCFVVDADPGKATNLLKLQQEYWAEYNKLTAVEKLDLCTMFMEECNSRTFGIHVNQKGHTQDIMNMFWCITAMVSQCFVITHFSVSQLGSCFCSSAIVALKPVLGLLGTTLSMTCALSGFSQPHPLTTTSLVPSQSGTSKSSGHRWRHF